MYLQGVGNSKMVSLSPYSTLLDLSATSELPIDESPSSTILRSQSLHGYQLPGNSNASGDYANFNNLGPVGSLEDFQRFKNGYECTSSRFGSLERPTKSDLQLQNDFQTKTDLQVPSKSLSGSKSSLLNEIHTAMNHVNNSNNNPEDVSDDGNETFINMEEEEDYIYMNIHVEILPMEQRFGFSVLGGADEDLSPRIDNISKGKLL